MRGISFGNFLIKQVVEELKAELPGLTRFSTLSPIPGFRRWLDNRLKQPDPPLEPAALADPDALETPLIRLCAQYLTETIPGRGPADPVARFHLGNGARLERLNWRGNLAPRGLKESYGIMVNYLYDPDTIEANHEAFASAGAVARSIAVEALLRPAAKRRPRII